MTADNTLETGAQLNKYRNSSTSRARKCDCATLAYVRPSTYLQNAIPTSRAAGDGASTITLGANESSNPTVQVGEYKASGAGRLRCFRLDVIISICGVNCVFDWISPKGCGSEGGAVCRYPGTLAPPPRAGIDNSANGEEVTGNWAGEFGADAGSVPPGRRGDGGADGKAEPSDAPESGLGSPLGGLGSSKPLSATSNSGRHSPASSSSV